MRSFFIILDKTFRRHISVRKRFSQHFVSLERMINSLLFWWEFQLTEASSLVCYNLIIFFIVWNIIFNLKMLVMKYFKRLKSPSKDQIIRELSVYRKNLTSSFLEAEMKFIEIIFRLLKLLKTFLLVFQSPLKLILKQLRRIIRKFWTQ